MMKAKRIFACITFFIFLIAFAVVASAATYTLTAIDSGWYDLDYGHDPTNDNYIVGNCCGSGEHRNYFVFDLSGVTGTITSATLEIENPYTPITPDPSENWTLYNVSTPVATLVAGGSPPATDSIFTDLGNGTSYGNVSVASNYTGIVTISLNASALAALNAAIGTSFALGGAITTLGVAENENIFPSTDSFFIRRLVLETDDTVAIPTMTEWGMVIFIVLTGLGAVYYLRRQRKSES